MGDKVQLFNPHDGLTGRDGGPYLDQEERRLAEIVRAAKEDRDPDFEHAPATAGTALVTANELVKIANPASVPSQDTAIGAMTNAVERLAVEQDFPVSAFAERDKTDVEKESERMRDNPQPFDNPASPTVVSQDVQYNAGDEKTGTDVAKAQKSAAKKSAPKAQTSSTTTKKAAAKKSTATSK